MIGTSERFHLHGWRDWNVEQFQDRWCDLQMGDCLIGVASPLTIGRDDEQRHFSLLRRSPTVMPITVNSMIARDEDGITTFPPFHEDGAEQDILLDGLPTILARIRAIGFARVIHHDRVEQQIIRKKLPYKMSG